MEDHLFLAVKHTSQFLRQVSGYIWLVLFQCSARADVTQWHHFCRLWTSAWTWSQQADTDPLVSVYSTPLLSIHNNLKQFTRPAVQPCARLRASPETLQDECRTQLYVFMTMCQTASVSFTGHDSKQPPVTTFWIIWPLQLILIGCDVQHV